MLTMRELTGDGFGKKERAWNAPEVLVGWREAWASAASPLAGSWARMAW